jgi:hypothetical protein
MGPETGRVRPMADRRSRSGGGGPRRAINPPHRQRSRQCFRHVDGQRIAMSEPHSTTATLERKLG